MKRRAAGVATTGLCLALFAGCSREAEPLAISKGGTPAGFDGVISVEKGVNRKLGELHPGARRIEEFELRNSGHVPVTLAEKIETSCGCSKALLSSFRLEPGQTAAVQLAINVSPALEGEQRVMGRVRILEPEGHPDIPLRVSYDVKRPWTVTPDRLVLTARPSETQIATIQLQSKSNTLLRLVAVSLDDPTFSPKIGTLDIISSATGLTVPLPFRAPDEPGTYERSLLVTTDCDSMPELRIPVVLSVISGVVAVPQTVVLKFDQPSKKPEQEIVLQSDKPFRIMRIACPDDRFQVTTDSSNSDPAKTAVCKVKADTSRFIGNLTRAAAIISCRCDDGHEDTVSISLLALHSMRP